jgi:hypothetical protein
VAPDHYSRVAQGFAAQGFVVVFVDYLGARGRKICGGMVGPGDVAKDILAAAAYASTQPSVRASDVSVIGWSPPGVRRGRARGSATLPGPVGGLVRDRPFPERPAPSE